MRRPPQVDDKSQLEYAPGQEAPMDEQGQEPKQQQGREEVAKKQKEEQAPQVRARPRVCGRSCMRGPLYCATGSAARRQQIDGAHPPPHPRAQPGPEEEEGDGGASEGEGGEEGGVNDDIDDRFEEQHHARPQARALRARLFCVAQRAHVLPGSMYTRGMPAHK